MSTQERLENFANSGAELIAEGCSVIDPDTSFLVVVSITKRATGQMVAMGHTVSDEIVLASRKAPVEASPVETLPPLVDEYAPADLKGLA